MIKLSGLSGSCVGFAALSSSLSRVRTCRNYFRLEGRISSSFMSRLGV